MLTRVWPGVGAIYAAYSGLWGGAPVPPDANLLLVLCTCPLFWTESLLATTTLAFTLYAGAGLTLFFEWTILYAWVQILYTYQSTKTGRVALQLLERGPVSTEIVLYGAPLLTLSVVLSTFTGPSLHLFRTWTVLSILLRVPESGWALANVYKYAGVVYTAWQAVQTCS